jgi:hypothetical protein
MSELKAWAKAFRRNPSGQALEDLGGLAEQAPTATRAALAAIVVDVCLGNYSLAAAGARALEALSLSASSAEAVVGKSGLAATSLSGMLQHPPRSLAVRVQLLTALAAVVPAEQFALSDNANSESKAATAPLRNTFVALVSW